MFLARGTKYKRIGSLFKGSDPILFNIPFIKGTPFEKDLGYVEKGGDTKTEYQESREFLIATL